MISWFEVIFLLKKKKNIINVEYLDADEDPVLIQVREHVEVLVEGILGGSLDSAHVDRPYINDQCKMWYFYYYTSFDNNI